MRSWPVDQAGVESWKAAAEPWGPLLRRKCAAPTNNRTPSRSRADTSNSHKASSNSAAAACLRKADNGSPIQKIPRAPVASHHRDPTSPWQAVHSAFEMRVSGLQPLAAHAAAFARLRQHAGRSHPISRTQIHRHIYFRPVPLPGQASWSTHPRASLLTHPLACPEISTSTKATTSCLRFLRPAFRGINPHKALAAWCYV